MTVREALDDDVVTAWVAGHPWWQLADGHLVREITTLDYPAAATIVARQVELAERLEHHPVITLGYRRVRLELWTHDRGALTQLDLTYAKEFDRLVETLR